MKYPRAVSALVAAAVVAAASVSAVAVADTGGGGGTTGRTISVTDDPAAAPQTTPRPALAAASAASNATVTLVTGDRVRLDVAPDGTQTTTVLGAPLATSTYVQFGWHGDRYVIPSAAVPYLAKTLDMRLFDVSYLVRAKLDDAHTQTLPLAVQQARTTIAPRLPGVRLAGANGTAVKHDAKAFGRMLATRWRANRTGASTTPLGRIDGISRISLAVPSGAPALPAPPTTASAVSPDSSGGGLPFWTVTLNPIDLNGQSGVMVGWLQNVDDSRLGVFVMNFDSAPGPVSFSVPEGTYSAMVSVMTGPASDFTVDAALVVKPQFTVDSDTSVNLDARTAKPYQLDLDPSIHAPAFRQDLLTFTRRSAANQDLRVQGFGIDGVFAIIALHLFSTPLNGNKTLYATPTLPVTKGSFSFMAFTQLAPDESVPSPDPRYRLVFPEPRGIPSSLTYHVAKTDLTTVHSRVFHSASGPDEQTALFNLVYLPWTIAQLGVAADVGVGERTDYNYSSAPDITVWQDAFNSSDGTRRWSTRYTVEPGQVIKEDWNRGPDTPSPAAAYLQTPAAALFGANQLVTDPNATVCSACRQDDNAMLYLEPLGDSDRSHYADTLETAATSQLRFWRNGTLAITSDSWVNGTYSPRAFDLPMLPGSASYDLQWAWSRKGDPIATTDTKWHFGSSSDSDVSDLPATEVCAPDASRRCTFLPLLFVTYDLALNDMSRAPAAVSFPVAFTVDHQQYAPAPHGLGATVSVSYNDGATWSTPQAATPSGGGRFSATITHPALADTTGYVSLRIVAHDSSGNSVTQTIIRAYGLTG